MSILVNPHNEQEEKLLIDFLNSMKYDYKPGIGASEDEVMQEFLDQYNKEIDEGEAEIEAGNYLDQKQVEKLFADRRKKVNGSQME
jgi:flagellar biosynthesis chaperone FliJ